MLTIIEKVIFLQNVDVFAGVSTEDLSYLAAIAEEVLFTQNHKIYNENDDADSLYLVLNGSVRLHKDDEEILIAGSKDAFGTWALFDGEPRVTSATALEDSKLLRIDKEDFYDLLSDHVQITQGIFKTLVKRLRVLVEKIDVDVTKGKQ